MAALIIDNALEYAILTLSRDGRILSWSPGAERIFGYTAAEAVGMDSAELFTAADVSAGEHRAEVERAMETGRAEDSRWHLKKGGERFWGNGVTMRVQTPEFTGLLKVLRDETAARLAEEQRVLLLHELNHRIKNTLATVQSIAEQTLRAAEVPTEARRVLTGRLIALSKAHDVLVDQSWAGADVEAIVRDALAPHERAAGKAFDIDGPPVRLSPPQAVSMALALHELATNAAKHGALRAAEGRITVTWNLALDGRGARRLNLLWRESGGPTVTPPTRRGFGARLISRTFGHESGGHAKLDYAPEGVRCVLQLPLSQAEELPILGPPERA